MKLLTGFAVALVVSAVNAAALVKRDISAPVQACINDIQAAVTPLPDAITSISALDASDTSFDAFLPGYTYAVNSQTALSATVNTCCNINTPYTDEESAAVTAAFSSFVTPQNNLLDVSVQKKPVIDLIEWGSDLWYGYITSVNNGVSSLAPCLIAQTPSSGLASLQSAIDSVNAGISAAATAYDISA